MLNLKRALLLLSSVRCSSFVQNIFMQNMQNNVSTAAAAAKRGTPRPLRSSSGGGGGSSPTSGSPEYQRNVLGETLEPCSFSVGSSSVPTGFFRDGYCSTCASDLGSHTVCAVVTREFLEFSRRAGNDLITPRMPGFPGLVEGDSWCLCAGRWKQAHAKGKAPKVNLRATMEKTLQFVDLEVLKQFSVEPIEEIDRDLERITTQRQQLENVMRDDTDDF